MVGERFREVVVGVQVVLKCDRQSFVTLSAYQVVTQTQDRIGEQVATPEYDRLARLQ